MKNKNLLLFFLIIMFGCSSNDIEHQDGFGNYDLSPDGKSIVFSWIADGKSDIYTSDIKGNDKQKIFSSQTSASFLNPRYSNDGKMIVFVSNGASSLNSALYIGDLNSRRIEQITDTNSIKTEAIFSPDNKKIYFCAANEYGNYSPIAAEAAHKFDIYSVTLSNRKSIKISNLNAYSLGGLAINSDTAIAFSVFAGDDGGVFQYNTSEKKSSRINSISDSLNNPSTFSNPVYFDRNKIFFTAFYKLILMDLETKQGNAIYLSYNFNIGNIRYSHSLNRLFFTNGNPDGIIYSIDIFGKNMQTIDLASKFVKF